MEISSNYSVNSQTTGTSTTREASSELDKDDFLTLYIEQLKNQDPLEPMDTNQMSTQMSQFSTVEQLINISSTLENMSSDSISNAVQFIGFQVTYGADVEDSDGNVVTEEKSGIVQSVIKKDGVAMLKLTDGTEVATDRVIGVELPGTTA